MSSCAFDSLLTKSVPHILEKIFLSLDYESYKTCVRVSNVWKELLLSEPFQGKAKASFRKEILMDEKKLWLTSKYGDVEGTKILLTSGLLDVNYTGLSTTLYEAAHGGHIQVVKLLLEGGANPNEGSYGLGNSPLFCASLKSNEEVIQLLLDSGADPNKPRCYTRCVPLHVAAKKYNTRVVKLLVDGGADINRANSSGWTPLHDATIKGSKEVVRLLLDRGADPNMKDYSGRSPLYIAVGERESGGGEEDIEKLLRERGAKAD